MSQNSKIKILESGKSAPMLDTPTDLTASQEALLRQLADERGEAVAPAETGFFARIKSAFK